MKITNYVFFSQRQLLLWCVVFDSEIEFGLVRFAEALQHLFGLYYILELVYPAQILKTLDFLQRCTMKIHSDNSRQKDMCLSALYKVLNNNNTKFFT
jgi:hypothetical protein